MSTSTSSKTYVVPYDFTSVAECATQHAINMARTTHSTVTLLHIAKNDKEVAIAKEKLKDVFAKLKLTSADPKVKASVIKGNIFEDIGKYATKNNARLIVMGTHGAKGMQKVFGSFAIKVITSCKVPFMIVQEKMPTTLNKIVVPINLTKESLQIISVVADLAMVFKSEIHVLGSKFTDPKLARSMKNRIHIVRDDLTQKKIKSTFKLLESTKSFREMVLDYGKDVNANLIAISYHTESIIPQLDKFAQSVITNKEQTPVLIIQAIDVTSGYF